MSQSSGNFDSESIEPVREELGKNEDTETTQTTLTQEKVELDNQPLSKKPGNCISYLKPISSKD